LSSDLEDSRIRLGMDEVGSGGEFLTPDDEGCMMGVGRGEVDCGGKESTWYSDGPETSVELSVEVKCVREQLTFNDSKKRAEVEEVGCAGNWISLNFGGSPCAPPVTPSS
jgi:hypothetical protein